MFLCYNQSIEIKTVALRETTDGASHKVNVMTTSDFTTKQCRACNEHKPLADYYPHPSTKDGYLNFCKPCFQKRTLHRKHPKDQAVNAGERLAIDKLRSVGFDAMPGKMSEWKHQDVVCGQVRVEVKKSVVSVDGYLFKFDSQVHSGMKSHIILLICDDVESVTFHVFPSDHAVFFNKHGVRKIGLAYKPTAKHRKLNSKFTLTPEIMNAHENKWELIRLMEGRI